MSGHMPRLDGVEAIDGQVVIHLDPEAATWLAGELPHNDGFTRDLWAAVVTAEQQVEQARQIANERPGLAIRVVMR